LFGSLLQAIGEYHGSQEKSQEEKSKEEGLTFF
jgi:hypothetical protein